ncbi:hypothetical protein COU80_01940 [Candidatus Peregrinibacteria bacterium CG10_big_fil_rev_8_21_14_0_10_55_24]|nr:MAG: hypothetical protein COU80_01940 [Candidatus Peregrinibacteria bacterium CG10_big_fil_rev_8_21_14_0_10_55_24]
MSPKPAAPAPLSNEGEPELSFIVPAKPPEVDSVQEERKEVLDTTREKLASLIADLDPNEVDTPPPLADEEMIG